MAGNNLSCISWSAGWACVLFQTHEVAGTSRGDRIQRQFRSCDVPVLMKNPCCWDRFVPATGCINSNWFEFVLPSRCRDKMTQIFIVAMCALPYDLSLWHKSSNGKVLFVLGLSDVSPKQCMWGFITETWVTRGCVPWPFFWMGT